MTVNEAGQQHSASRVNYLGSRTGVRFRIPLIAHPDYAVIFDGIALSSFNCEMMSMVPPRGEDCNRVPAILRANHCNPNRTLRVLASIAALPDRFSRETGD